jgi:amino-acid N-acetyltransferase
MIRNAHIRDVPRMAAIINDCAEQGQMLHRSLGELYEDLRDFRVWVGEFDEVLAIVGLRLMWANLAEVYALAVAEEARGQGVGKKLVLDTVAQAEQIGVRRVFALTYEQQFFERCGFSVCRRDRLPLKVWSECVRCSKRSACDEIAMIRVLESVPDLAPPIQPTEQSAIYDVPVTIRRKG